MELHPDCEPLAFLLGTWKGRGAGEYPTIESFTYNEEVTFGHVGKPFLAYSQRTRHAVTGVPLHAESGYLRVADGVMDLSLVQPTGIIEAHRLTVTTTETGHHLSLSLASVSFSPTASEVASSITDVARELTVEGDVMRYTMAMAAAGHPLTHHLRAELHRES